MTKKKPFLHVDGDLSDLGLSNLSEVYKSKQSKRKLNDSFPVEKALRTVIRQMKAAGLRERTISDYDLHINNFFNVTGVQYMEELNANHIYEWLASMNVSNSTKLIRLKCLKAFLNRCFDNGWLESRFWKNIQIKVDTPIKEGTTERDIQMLLSLLDLSKFVELRDAAAVLLMYQTGIRIGTLARLEHKHVNLDSCLLVIDGGIVKNHENIYLPFDDVLARLLTVLMNQNEIIRRERNKRNNLLFITKNGDSVLRSPTNNHISKRLNMYRKEYGLKNINPHALRRGFAKNLLKKGANISLISKALGHSDLAVTTRYLHLGKEEVAESLRKFL